MFLIRNLLRYLPAKNILTKLLQFFYIHGRLTLPGSQLLNEYHCKLRGKMHTAGYTSCMCAVSQCMLVMGRWLQKWDQYHFVAQEVVLSVIVYVL